METRENGDGLASVKKPDMFEYVPEAEYKRRISEIIKCKRDICYFAENYFRIINLDKGLGIIKLYEKQRELLKFLVANDRDIVLAARQSGKTTCYSIFTLWYTIFTPDKAVLLAANKKETAIGIMDRIRMAYEYLPAWLKPGITVYNKSELTFSNKSTIKGFATASSACRGFSANCLVLDELAFVPKNITDEFFASVYPVISSSKSSKVIAVSTSNGYGNLYHDLWASANSNEAKKNTEGWKAFRIDWWEVPGRDEEWKKQQMASIGNNRFRQEFGNEFLASTFKKLVPDDVIESYRKKLTEYKSKGLNQGVSLEIRNSNAKNCYSFRMWHERKDEHAYLASADVADGSGGDSSVLYVWDVTDTSKITPCAKFISNSIPVIEFAYVIHRICSLFGNPYLAVESNSIGAELIHQLSMTYSYENFVKLNKKNEPGIFSHVQIKSKACLWFKEMMTTAGVSIEVYDKEAVNEMETFIRKDTASHLVYNALRGSHDDSIISLIWMAYVLSPENVENYFTVVSYFTTSLGKSVPRILASNTDDFSGGEGKEGSEESSSEKSDLMQQWNSIKEANDKMYAENLEKIKQEEKSDPFFKNEDDSFDASFPEGEGGSACFFGGGGWGA